MVFLMTQTISKKFGKLYFNVTNENSEALIYLNDNHI